MILRNMLLSGLAIVGFLANAATVSLTGDLDQNNPNDVALVTFELTRDSGVLLQSWGYGGSSGAPGGTNGVGNVVPPGGFDPYLSLFQGLGESAVFLASNDDGQCPPGTPSPACADSTLSIGNLRAGNYTLAISLPFNYSLAENIGAGTLGDGFIGLDASFSDGSCGSVCTNHFAVDVVSAGLVPENGTRVLLLLGLLGLFAAHRKQRALSSAAGLETHLS